MSKIGGIPRPSYILTAGKSQSKNSPYILWVRCTFDVDTSAAFNGIFKFVGVYGYCMSLGIMGFVGKICRRWGSVHKYTFPSIM